MGCGCSTPSHVDFPREHVRPPHHALDAANVTIDTGADTTGNVFPFPHPQSLTPASTDPSLADKHPPLQDPPTPAAAVQSSALPPLAPISTNAATTNAPVAPTHSIQLSSSSRSQGGSRKYLVGVPVPIQEYTPDADTNLPPGTLFVKSVLGVTYPYDVPLDTDERPCWNSMLPTMHRGEPIHLHADRRAAAGIRTSSDAKKAPTATELFLQIPVTEKGALEHYNVIGVLGKGTFGEVKEIQHKVTFRKYALKTIAYSQAKISSISREWNVLEFIGRHPFIIGYYETYRTEERVDFVFEIAEGGDLHTRLAYAGPLEERTARIAFRGLALALQYLHKRGVIHRDLKPENILVTQHGYSQLHCTCGVGRESRHSVFLPQKNEAADAHNTHAVSTPVEGGASTPMPDAHAMDLPPPNSKVNKHLAYVVKTRKNTSLLSLKTDRMPAKPLFSPESCHYRPRANSQFEHKYTCPIYLATDCRGFDDSDFLVLKISDFGLSQIIGNNERLLKVAGTWTFAAPEMKDPNKQGYSTLFDCWSFGVIVFTALAASHPFDPEATLTTPEIHKRIMSGQFDFSDPIWRSISPAAKDLITKLLVVPQEKRLNTDGILNHPWISGVVNPYTFRWQLSQKLYLLNRERMLELQQTTAHPATTSTTQTPVQTIAAPLARDGTTEPAAFAAAAELVPEQPAGLEESSAEGAEAATDALVEPMPAVVHGDVLTGGIVVDQDGDKLLGRESGVVDRVTPDPVKGVVDRAGYTQAQSTPTYEKSALSNPASRCQSTTELANHSSSGNGDSHVDSGYDNNPDEIVHSNPTSPYRTQSLVQEQGYDTPETSKPAPLYDAFSLHPPTVVRQSGATSAGVPAPTAATAPAPVPALVSPSQMPPETFTTIAMTAALPNQSIIPTLPLNPVASTDTLPFSLTNIRIPDLTAAPLSIPNAIHTLPTNTTSTPIASSSLAVGIETSVGEDFPEDSRHSPLERALSDSPPLESAVFAPASPLLKAKPMFPVRSEDRLESRMDPETDRILLPEPIPSTDVKRDRVLSLQLLANKPPGGIAEDDKYQMYITMLPSSVPSTASSTALSSATPSLSLQATPPRTPQNGPIDSNRSPTTMLSLLSAGSRAPVVAPDRTKS